MQNESKSKLDLTNLIKFFESKEAILLALLFALATQISHSIIAYSTIDTIILNNGKLNYIEISYWSYFFGMLFSIAISVAILIFTLRNNKLMAYFFVLVEIFINIIYSRLDNQYNQWLFYSILFLACIIPIIIAAYSHQVDKDKNKNISIINLNKEEDLIQLNKLIDDLNIKLENKVNKQTPLEVEVKSKDKVTGNINIIKYEMKIN